MRVLDVGSGAGDVAFLVASLVGDQGAVVGVDRVPAALATARARAAALSLRNVTFVEGDLATITFQQPFDAIIGRYVLMFQDDPAALLRSIAAHARPAGVIVFHELDWGAAWSFPPIPTYDRSCRQLVECLGLAGTEPRMGLKLHTTFLAAGLPAPTMAMSARVGGGAESRDSANLPLESLVRCSRRWCDLASRRPTRSALRHWRTVSSMRPRRVVAFSSAGPRLAPGRVSSASAFQNQLRVQGWYVLVGTVTRIQREIRTGGPGTVGSARRRDKM